MSDELVLVEKRASIGIITMNRPKALNALCFDMIKEMAAIIDDLEADEEIGAIIITGNEKAFAAGTDVNEMAGKTFSDVYLEGFMRGEWERVARCRKPVIAAVAGYALGGGCELALMCDFIIAADNARFGQPEITLGFIPSLGGTQRLTRAIGKAKTMEMILTGRSIEADEAEKTGLVARVVPLVELMNDAIRTAERIAMMSRPAVMMAKDAINKSYESSLSDGLVYEKQLFNACFATEDHNEGIIAFTEKRLPQFNNR